MAEKPKKAKLLPQIVAALTGCIGGLGLGTAIGWGSPAEKLIRDKYNYKAEEWSWINSIFALGAAFSVIPLPFLMDKIGRKMCMIIIGICLAISWLILGFAEHLWLFIMARFLTGFFSGSFCVVSPVYTAEVVEPRIRGALGSCFQLFIVFGILITFCLGLASHIKLLSFFCVSIPLIMIALLIFLPDTPLFLINAGKDEKKIDASYRFLRGKEYDFTQEKVDLTQDLIEANARKAGGVMSKFKSKATKKAFAICMLLNVAQQLSGINAVMYYSTSIIESSGSSIQPIIGTVILGIGQVLGTLVSVFISDRGGRKLLLIISFALMAFCLLCLGIYLFFQARNPNSVKSVGALPVILITLYVIVFSIGAGPLPWAILGEMFSAEVKSVVSSICAFSNWFLAFLVTKFFPLMSDALKNYGAVWFYAACGVVCTILIVLFVMETKNKTLQEIQIALEG